jgi:hypothetical protein
MSTCSNGSFARLLYCYRRHHSNSSLVTQCALLFLLLQRTRAREKAVSMSERQEEMDKAAEKRWSQLQVLELQLKLQVVYTYINFVRVC